MKHHREVNDVPHGRRFGTKRQVEGKKKDDRIEEKDKMSCIAGIGSIKNFFLSKMSFLFVCFAF